METKKISTEQRNNLIGLLIIILIVAGIFYFKANKTAEEIIEEPKTEEENIIPAEEGEVEEETKPVVKVLTDKEKFNIALSNGSRAFLDKDYESAIKYYYGALSYINSDLAYIRIFDAYNAQNDIDNARPALENAIKLNPSYTEYWITKIAFLDDKTGLSYADLKRVYEEALTKVDYRTKINLVTAFARVAENNQQKSDAIALWEEAIKLYPQNVSIYQAEINRIKTQ